MSELRPFRALRYAPSRVDLAACLGDGDDPRRVRRLLEASAPATRAALFLAEWRRAGVLTLDEQPSLTVVKRRPADSDDDVFAFFAALGEPPAHAVVEPRTVPYDDETGRVKRALASAADREPDATVTLFGDALEAFVIDDESTAARIAALISGATRPPEIAPEATLAFFVDKRDTWARVPTGLAILPARAS